MGKRPSSPSTAAVVADGGTPNKPLQNFSRTFSKQSNFLYILLYVGHFVLLYHMKKQEEKKVCVTGPGSIVEGVCERWVCDRGALLWGGCERWMYDEDSIVGCV